MTHKGWRVVKPQHNQSISVGRPGYARYTKPSPHPTTPYTPQHTSYARVIKMAKCSCCIVTLAHYAYLLMTIIREYDCSEANMFYETKWSCSGVFITPQQKFKIAMIRSSVEVFVHHFEGLWAVSIKHKMICLGQQVQLANEPKYKIFIHQVNFSIFI